MVVPFGLGKILDIIYDTSTETENAKKKLDQFCTILAGIFLIGGFANFGRVYLFGNACKLKINGIISLWILKRSKYVGGGKNANNKNGPRLRAKYQKC